MKDFQQVLDFWFKQLTPKDWFKKSNELDRTIEQKFLETLTLAKNGELSSWRETPHGRLAEIIVLDQFSRNIFRGQKESFAQDALALQLAKEAVALQLDQQLSTAEKVFLYLPYMHSEQLEDHKIALKLYDQEGMEINLEYEIKHKVIIERFGRYPHRNKILGRSSTSEEIEFLKQPDSSF